MFFILSLFWYCYDDWLAQVTDTPWVGEVPFIIWLIVFLISDTIDQKLFGE